MAVIGDRYDRWLYNIFPVYTFSALLGVFELAAAVLIALKPIAPRLSVVGSALAVVLFVSTVSFLFTTPGVSESAGGGFPALSLTGEFLLKDLPLLGLSFWTLADSLRAASVGLVHVKPEAGHKATLDN
jgi:reactive chlorine resistance protein C